MKKSLGRFVAEAKRDRPVLIGMVVIHFAVQWLTASMANAVWAVGPNVVEPVDLEFSFPGSAGVFKELLRIDRQRQKQAAAEAGAGNHG